MRHTFWMVLLGIGAVAGFASGFARLHHHRHGGDFCYLRGGVERRAADACTRAALDVLEERKTAKPDR
jgi:hypothetical protein